MTTRIEFDGEQFNTFLRCLSNLKGICNDVDIRGGIIRQRTNDLTSVFEIDLTTLIGNVAIPITNLKNKFDILKTFAGRDVVNIEIFEADTESESYYIIRDDQYAIKTNFPSLDFMDNKYMSEDERDGIFLLDDEEMILHTQLSSMDTDRVRVVVDNFNTKSIQFRFENDKAMFGTSTQSKDQKATFKSDIPINVEFGENAYISNLSAIPFCIEHDNQLDFKMFKDPQQNMTYNKIKTELDIVDVCIYSRSALVEDID